MKHFAKVLSLVITAVFCLSLTACGEKETVERTLNIVNNSGKAIEQIFIAPQSSSEWGLNRLNSILQSGVTIEIYLGAFSPEEIENGFNVLVYGENQADIYDSSFAGEQIFINDRDYFILMPPDNSITYYVQNTYNAADYSGDEGGAPDPNAPIYQDGDEGGTPDPDDPIYQDGDESGASNTTESEFSYLKGEWYKDEDINSDFFSFDNNGNWSLYIKNQDSSQAMLMDKGYVEESSESESLIMLISDTSDDCYAFFYFDTDIATISLGDGEGVEYDRIR